MTDTYNSVVAEEERQRRERATRQGAISPEGHRALAELAQRRDALAEAPTLSLGPPRPNWTPRNLAERERYDQEMSRWNYQRSQAVAARFNVSLLGDASPDEVARRQRNAELYGTSAMSTDLQRQQRDAEIISASPQFSDHFANPINAELSRDDIRPLSFWQIIGDLFRMSNTTGDFSNRAARRQAAELVGDQNRVAANMRRHVGRGVYQAYIASLAERENPESALDAEGSNSAGAPITRRLGNFVYSNSRLGDEQAPLTQAEQYELNAYRHDDTMGLIAHADMADNFGGWFLENIVPTAQGLAEIPGGIGRGAGLAWERAVRNWDMGGGGTPADAIERTWAVLSLAPDVAVSGTIGAFTGPIAYTYQQEAGNAYLEFTQMMDDNGEFMDRRIAGAYARDVGSINSIFELVNLTVIGKALGVGKLGGFLASAGVRSAFRRYALNEGLRRMVLGVGETALSEGVTEAAQEVSVVALGDMARMADSGELDMLSPGEVASRLFDTVMANSGRILEAGVAGAIIGGGIGTVVAPITIGSLIEDARVGEYQQEIWRSIETQSESSKLRERAPGVYQRLISKLVQGTPLEQIAINVEDFIGAFHQDVDMARAAARELEGVGAEAFDEAQKTGGDIFIPASTMSAQIAGTEQYQHIAEHSKLGPDVASIAEVKARLELGVDVERAIEAGTKLNEQLLTLEEAKGRVRQEFLDRLNGSETWSQSEFNDALAELFAEGYFTIAKAAGMDPEKMPSIPVITGPFGQRQMTQAEIDAGGFSTQEEELSKKARGATAFQRSVDTFMTGAHIAFTETRNESTAPHEIFGHYFLELLRFAAAQSTATPILKQDWQTTLDYLGMTNERWEAALQLTDKQEAARQLAPAHEKFARAVEVYFKEGRAPSPRLKRVFRMFKVWMVRAFSVTKRMDAQQVITHPLYKDLLDDRIRPVLDRMFASQEAVAEYAAMMGSDEIMTREEWGGVGNKHADASYERYKNGIVNARRRAEEAIDAAAIAVIVKENMRERRRAETRARKTVDAEMAQDPTWIAHDLITGRFELPNTPGVRLNSAMVFQEYGKDTHESMPRGSFDIDTEGLVEMAMEARSVREPTRFAARVQQLGIHDPSGQIEAIQGNKKGLRKAGEGRSVSEAIQILWDEGWFGSRNNAEEYFQSANRDAIPAMARDGTQVSIVVNPTKTKLLRMTTAPLWDRDNPWNYDSLRWVKDDQGRMWVAPAKLLHDEMVAALKDAGVEITGWLYEAMPHEGHGAKVENGWIRRDGEKLIFSNEGIGDTYLQATESWSDKAKADGFDLDAPLYHATNVVFDGELDPEYAGSGANAGLFEEAIFLTDAPAVADSYLAGGFVRSENARGASVDLGGGVARWYADGANVRPVYVRPTNFDDWDFGGGGYKPSDIARVIREAKERGANGAVVRNIKDPGIIDQIGPVGNPRRPSNLVIVFNKDDVISRFSETYLQPFDGDVATGWIRRDGDQLIFAGSSSETYMQSDSPDGGASGAGNWQAELRVARGSDGNWSVVDQTGERQSEHIFETEAGARAALQNMQADLPEMGNIRTLPDGDFAGREPTRLAPDAPNASSSETYYQPFDTGQTFYHGTTADVRGALRASADGLLGAGVYIAVDESSAGEYAAGDGGQIIPVYKRQGKIAHAGRMVGARTAAQRAAVVDGLKADGFIGIADPENGFVNIFSEEDVASIFDLRVAEVYFQPYDGDVARFAFDEHDTLDRLTGDSRMRVSTRQPSSVKSTEDAIADRLVIGLDSVLAEPVFAAKVAEHVRTGAILPVVKGETDAQTLERYIQLVIDNLLWLHDSYDAETRDRADEWYNGARTITDAWMMRYGYHDYVIAGVIAALSPQLDWFQNVSLAERVLDTYSMSRDFKWTPEMHDTADRILPRVKEDGDGYQKVRDDIDGRSILDIEQAFAGDDYTINTLVAAWIRIYDQTYNDASYRVIMPEGSFGDFVKTTKGANARVGWKSLPIISNAVSMIRNSNYENISSSLGAQHKVRNFYNNILAPNAPHGDVTIDTHAVAAAQLRPLSQADKDVTVNLSGPPKSAITGSIGTYGVHAEAYRRAAVARGILPRQMQSITWEAIRTLFTAPWKTEKNRDVVNSIWQEYRDGKATIEETRDKISAAAGGIKPPSWVGVRSVDGLHASEGHSTYEGELPRARISRWTTGMDARAGRPAADRTATRAERYYQLEEEFAERSDEMVSRVVGDVGLTRDETFKIYEGLLADHNEKMIRAMRLSLGVDATSIGTREARAAEAQVEAISSHATMTDLMGRLIARYGQDAVTALGAPISWDMRNQVISTESLNMVLRERIGEANNLKRMRSSSRNYDDFALTPDRIDATLADVNAEAELIKREIERRTTERALGAWQPSGGVAAVARASDDEVMDWFNHSGEVRVGRQRNGDPVIHFKTDPSLKNFNAHLTFDQIWENGSPNGGYLCATIYRGRFNNRDYFTGKKKKPTAAQRQLAMAFFTRMALVTRAFVIMNKPKYLEFTGGSQSHEKLYLSMMRTFDFSGYTARRRRSISASIRLGAKAINTVSSTVSEAIDFVLLSPEEALKQPPVEIPPTAVSEHPFASNQMDIVGPGEGARRRAGTLIWFAEETLDVKNPTGAAPTRDPKASRYFSRGNPRDVRFVPLGIGSDGALQASSLGAKEAALRTLNEAEGWFYQEEEAPTEGEFLDALRDDVSGVSPRYRAQDIDASFDWQEAKKVREFFGRRGIDISSKPAELQKQIALIAEQLDSRGVDADTMASMLNAHLGYKAFASGREMIDAVAALPKRSDHIKQRVDQIVRGELGDPMDDMPSAAALSMHNINEEQRILMELQATQEAAGSGATRAINRTAKEYAERRVSKMSVRQIQNPDWALTTERRWAKAASEANRKGDPAAANKAKLNQLIHFHIYKLARATKNEMDRAQLYFKKLQKLSARTRITPDYFEQIDALLDQYELRNMSTKEVARRISLSDWVKSMEDRGLGHMVQIDPDVIARSQRIPFQQLTIEQARALRDAVKNLDHLGTLKDKLLTAAEQRSFEAVLVDLIGAMKATGPVGKNVTRNYSEDDVQKVSARMRRWNAALTRMEFLFRYIDGQHNGKVWRTLFLPFTKAADIESAFQHRVAAQLTNLWDKYSPSERASMFKTRITIPELAVDSDVTGLNDTFTRMELIAIALNLGNNGNVAALVDGFKWFAAPAGMETDYAAAKTKIIAALDKHLTKRDWEFVQETWSIIGQFRDEAFNLHQRLTGLRPEEVEADPIASKHGTFAGGYYPLKFDPLRDAVTERREAKENTPVSNWGVSSLSPMTKKGHLIDRKGSGGRPVRLDFGVATDHIQNVIHDLAYREALIDANRIISDERFRAAFIRTVGKEQYAQLHPWLHSIAVEYRDPTSDIGKLMQRMRGNMQIVTMGAKIATATQQIAGLLQAVPMLGSAEMAGGVVRMLNNPFAMREKSEYIMSKSEFMRTRVRSFNRDVREFLRRVQDDTLVHKTQRNAFALVGAMDWAVSSVVWITAYEKARAGKVQGIEAGVEEDAVRFADSMVRQTQSAGLNQDLPLIMRNTEMEKLITAFYSYFSVLYNWTAYDQVLGVRKGRVPLYIAAGNFFLIYVMAPIMTEWLAGRWDKDGEDDEEKWKRMLSVVARMPFSSIPLARDVVNTIGSFYDYSLTPFESGVQSAIDTVGDIASGEILSSERAQKNAAFAVGFVFGLPTAQVYITADYLRDYAEGEEEGLDLTEALLRDTR